jgi:hypothetical protein
MTEDNLDPYRKANQDLYDETAKQFREACKNPSIYQTGWRKELKQRMKLLDLRLKGLGED